jgi:hypothetical protein
MTLISQHSLFTAEKVSRGIQSFRLASKEIYGLRQRSHRQDDEELQQK